MAKFLGFSWKKEKLLQFSCSKCPQSSPVSICRKKVEKAQHETGIVIELII